MDMDQSNVRFRKRKKIILYIMSLLSIFGMEFIVDLIISYTSNISVNVSGNSYQFNKPFFISSITSLVSGVFFFVFLFNSFFPKVAKVVTSNRLISKLSSSKKPEIELHDITSKAYYEVDFYDTNSLDLLKKRRSCKIVTLQYVVLFILGISKSIFLFMSIYGANLIGSSNYMAMKIGIISWFHLFISVFYLSRKILRSKFCRNFNIFIVVFLWIVSFIAFSMSLSFVIWNIVLALPHLTYGFPLLGFIVMIISLIFHQIVKKVTDIIEDKLEIDSFQSTGFRGIAGFIGCVFIFFIISIPFSFNIVYENIFETFLIIIKYPVMWFSFIILGAFTLSNLLTKKLSDKLVSDYIKPYSGFFADMAMCFFRYLIYFLLVVLFNHHEYERNFELYDLVIIFNIPVIISVLISAGIIYAARSRRSRINQKKKQEQIKESIVHYFEHVPILEE